VAPELFPRALKRVERRSSAFGAEASLVAYHEDRDTAERAVAAAFRALDEIEDLLSLYRPHSALCRLNRDGVFKIAASGRSFGHPGVVGMGET
jgi:thiamine biosynthesis lipoprotein ApbE